MNLYDYQKNVLKACREDKSYSQLISMPTGTGKTITFLALTKEFDKRTLIIVHREELLKQTFEKALRIGFREEDISLVCADKKEKLKKLNIAMVQSLSRNLLKYDPSEIDMVIIDEAHHATARSYLNVLHHFKVVEEEKYLFGFTATPLRGDRDHLSWIFHSHSFKMTLSEATQLGYIVPVHGVRVEMNKSLNEIDMKQGDYDLEALEKVMNCDSVNEIIVDRCKNLTKTPAIVFTTSVNHAQELAERLRKVKRKAISISYKTPKRTLSRIFRMLEQGRIEFITNAVKLSEGFDFPAIKSVILARPTRSPVLYKQMIGRGLRNFKDKHDCFVLEFTSNDPKMMCWEDIDETCTFQSTTETKKRTREEAKMSYSSIFRSPNVQVLDVRESHFDYYECKLRRHVKYRSYYFTPFTEGFAFYEITKDIKPGYDLLYNVYASMFFWKEKYKSFYAWDQPNVLMTNRGPITKKEIIWGPDKYGKINNLGKWYPSEHEPCRRDQILKMKELNIPFKNKSARKAEIEIEDRSIKIAIDKYLSRHIFSGVMEI